LRDRRRSSASITVSRETEPLKLDRAGLAWEQSAHPRRLHSGRGRLDAVRSLETIEVRDLMESLERLKVS
jgi:hypothetical protein